MRSSSVRVDLGRASGHLLAVGHDARDGRDQAVDSADDRVLAGAHGAHDGVLLVRHRL